ncbi:alpha/beta hydrolase [Leucobacter allii]|uniref:alpha/beta fold hydrolase n=1 Tax=Leucobacter allii TaxID=2932247 RepID=UPI001FD51B4C|nr:alpha/beta fold hydrolase [Leucobacter allii]UOR00504.1 alpha/beta hydrolase [Leucobacter allii]
MALAAHHFPAADSALAPVLLLHGFASSADEDFLTTGWAESLAAAGRPTIAIDLPGHGDSPAVASADEATTSAVIAAILAAVEAVSPAAPGDAVGAAPIDVIGYSLGARLAWELPAASPRVRRLVLGGISPAEPFAAIDPADLAATLAGRAPAHPLTGMMAGMIQAPGRDTASLARVIAGLAAEPFAPGAGGPAVPTLLVAGLEDALTTGVEELAAALPAVHLERVPGDHRAALDGPEFRAAAIGFLAD